MQTPKRQRWYVRYWHAMWLRQFDDYNMFSFHIGDISSVLNAMIIVLFAAFSIYFLSSVFAH